MSFIVLRNEGKIKEKEKETLCSVVLHRCEFDVLALD